MILAENFYLMLTLLYKNQVLSLQVLQTKITNFRTHLDFSSSTSANCSLLFVKYFVREVKRRLSFSCRESLSTYTCCKICEYVRSLSSHQKRVQTIYEDIIQVSRLKQCPLVRDIIRALASKQDSTAYCFVDKSSKFGF